MDPLATFRMPADLWKQLHQKGWLQEQMQEGKSLQEIIGFSDETMKQFYEAAYRLYNAGKESEAADAFLFLTTLNSSVEAFWLGLGMAEQCLQHYEEALSAYAMASMIIEDDPLPYYHSAACYQALQENENVRKSLELALQYFGPEHASLKATAEDALKRLS